MTVNYHDPVTDADVALKSNIVGGEHVPVHDINALPGTVESDIGGSKTFLQTLAGIVTTSRAAVNVDTVTTGKLDSIITALGSYLSTLAGSVSAGRVAIDVSTTIATYLSNLPTLATYLSTLQGAISGGLMQAFAPDVTASATLAIVGDKVTLAMSGRQHASFAIGAGLSSCTATVEASTDGGTNYSTVATYSFGSVPPTLGLLGSLSGSALSRGILLPPGTSHVQVRVISGTPSGSATATLRATMAGDIYINGQLPAALGVAAAASSLSVALCTTDTAKLDTLHTDLAPAGPKMDQVGSIGTSADVQFASKTLAKGMAIKNISIGGQSLYLKDVATPTSSNSCVLLPGEWSNDIECTNANAIFMRASASGGAACYSGR